VFQKDGPKPVQIYKADVTNEIVFQKGQRGDPPVKISKAERCSCDKDFCNEGDAKGN
jgi:hypothetical protein